MSTKFSYWHFQSALSDEECDKIIELKDGSINGLYNNKEYVEKFKKLF